MNIYDALKNVRDWKKREYFKWKHDIRYDQRLEKKTEEQFLKSVDKKTMNPYLAWERSPEYKGLLAIYLDSRMANDLEEIYSVVSTKAKEGDSNSVKLFLSLHKEIQQHAKNADKAFKDISDNDETEDEDDGLEL
ncbi:hypothetical protein [Bacillus horti]|uniref:Uncharacterized protein n=1 Tax=Caldalkalibacillus horti TaxID=77523 RepID=A0ABT9W562_9BACI|nr:hypothetical protein [Bacillus horti]MDQ0168212.1 hypothetical protein [Bacillus horti]